MTERTIEQIRSDIANLKKESESISTVIAQSTTLADPAAAKSAYEDSFFLGCTVVGLGVFVLTCITYLIRTDKQVEGLLRPFATILIIISAVFLIVAGYSEKQIAPVIGLLGTIAGYALGRDDSSRRTSLKSTPTHTDG